MINTWGAVGDASAVDFPDQRQTGDASTSGDAESQEKPEGGLKRY